MSKYAHEVNKLVALPAAAPHADHETDLIMANQDLQMSADLMFGRGKNVHGSREDPHFPVWERSCPTDVSTIGHGSTLVFVQCEA